MLWEGFRTAAKMAPWGSDLLTLPFTSPCQDNIGQTCCEQNQFQWLDVREELMQHLCSRSPEIA